MQHWSKTLLIAAAALAASVSIASTAMTTPAIGEVTLLLGKAHVRQHDGTVVPVKVGMPVHVSDLIETENKGHVHIRFVDDALVSVRPSSSLEILRYDYDPAQPRNSAVKMNLIEGEAHAISGEAAKSARQNYRMNTPIAAIGVRGTDFTVSASAESVRAIVNEGAIVVAPFSNGCSAESLGPCNQDAVELNGLSRQMLELNADEAGVRSSLLALDPAETRQAVARAAERAEANVAPKAAEDQELYADTVTTRTVNTRLATSGDAIKTPDPISPGPLAPEPAPPPEFTPIVAETPAVLTKEAQLVWGRWHETNLSNERISVPYDVAVQGGRRVSVGNLRYALFRNESNGTEPRPGLGVLSFGLNKAQATYRVEGRAELMGVSGGQLTLDFDKALFSTTLQLNHQALGDYQFATSGRIYSGGVFHSNTDTQLMAGAVSSDGKEAGYFFERRLDTGTIEGLTLWNQMP